MIAYFRTATGTGNIDSPYVVIGRHTYGVIPSTILLASSPDQPTVSIGGFCSFAPGVKILANADHRTTLPSTYPFRSLLFDYMGHEKENDLNYEVTSRGSVEIGHDVWIGLNATILSGVTIGTGAVIGAGSVVTRDVPPYAIAAGNPAKVVRFRFPSEIIDGLLKTKWWLLADEEIYKLELFFYSDDISAFIDKIRFDYPCK